MTSSIAIWIEKRNQKYGKIKATSAEEDFMPSPFPGMNPHLEPPVFWSEFHNRLIVADFDPHA
jgi:hypothetical protein